MGRVVSNHKKENSSLEKFVDVVIEKFHSTMEKIVDTGIERRLGYCCGGSYCKHFKLI